jgi:hypothetical protein
VRVYFFEYFFSHWLYLTHNTNHKSKLALIAEFEISFGYCFKKCLQCDIVSQPLRHFKIFYELFKTKVTLVAIWVHITTRQVKWHSRKEILLSIQHDCVIRFSAIFTHQYRCILLIWSILFGYMYVFFYINQNLEQHYFGKRTFDPAKSTQNIAERVLCCGKFSLAVVK